MARLPRDPAEAVAELGLEPETTAIAIGPADGYVEALADAVGTKGRVIVQHPPPEFKSRKKAVSVVDELPMDTKADVLIAWVPVVPVSAVRELVEAVAEDGALWVVLPKADRDKRVPVGEGDLKRMLLPLGWRETKAIVLATDALGVRYHRRR